MKFFSHFISQSLLPFFFNYCIIIYGLIALLYINTNVEVINMTVTRIPKQKKAIDKRDKIIRKGFELMCNKGFHHVSTPDIAKHANVSTGILYQYFEDKREIFIEGTKKYCVEVLYPMLYTEIDNIKLDNTNILVKGIIKNFTNNCINNGNAQRELIAMSHYDNEIASIINSYKKQLVEKIVCILHNNNFKIENAFEKVHLSVTLIGQYCRDMILNNQKHLDYGVLHNHLVDTVSNLLA